MAIGDRTRITVQEFERILANPANQDRLLELIDGEIVEKIPTQQHGAIVINIATEIRIYLKQNRIGIVSTEVRHGSPDDDTNDRLPDLSFVQGDLAPVEQGVVPQMPDLAVEVKSPSDDLPPMLRKANFYLDNGSQMVWLVYPESQQVEQLTRDPNGNTQRQIFALKDTLSGGNVLPGFTLPVEVIFGF